MATTTKAEVTFRNHGIPRILTFAFLWPSLVSTWVYFPVPCCILSSCMSTPFSLFHSHLHITSATSHAIPVPGGRLSLLVTPLRKDLLSTFNDLLQTFPSFPLISLHPPFHHFQELWPLFFFIILLFRLTLRCHLDPQSTLASPDFLFASMNVLFSCAHCRPSSSILARTLSVNEFSR